MGVSFFSHLWTFLYSCTDEPDSKLLSLSDKTRLYHPPHTLYMSFSKAGSGLFFGDVAWFSNGLVFRGPMGIFLFLRLVLFCFIQILKKLFFLENKLLWVGVVLFLFLLDSLLIHLLFGLMGKNWGTLKIILKTSMSQGFFTFLLFLFDVSSC